MRIEINKTDLITLALVYNYLANDKTKLKVSDVNNFISLLDFTMFNKSFSASYRNEEDDEKTYYYIDEDRYYNLRSVDYIATICHYYVDVIPQDIFLETMKPEFLSLIGVEKDNLKLIKTSESKNDSMQLYSMGASSASLNAVKILKERGCRNIMVNSVFFLGMKPDYLWNVSVKYDQDRYFLDLGSKEKVFCKRF